jgi:hypothetical protein
VASSSAAIGKKRSDLALGTVVYKVKKLLAYVSKELMLEKLYVVVDVMLMVALKLHLHLDKSTCHSKNAFWRWDSQFTVDVPKIYTDRDFFFLSMVLLPNFYSLEALAENLEEDQVLDTPTIMKYHSKFLTQMHLHSIQRLQQAKTLQRQSNWPMTSTSFFKQDSGVLSIGQICNSTEMWKVGTIGSKIQWPKHFNAFPTSARTVAGTNNYFIPTSMTEETLAIFLF